MQTEAVEIILADAHSFSRAGLEQTLAEAGLGKIIEADSAETCLRLVARHRPCLLLLAGNLLPADPMPFITELHRQHPDTPIILFPANCEALPLPALLAAGVRGIVTKAEPREALVQVVQTVAAGQNAFTPKVMAALANAAREATYSATLPALTVREMQLLNLLAQGLNNREIAAEMNLAYQTVRNLLLNLYRKIKVSNRTAAIQWARQHNLLAE
jgi:DNA-binding NarL/FixJ family response regulator